MRVIPCCTTLLTVQDVVYGLLNIKAMQLVGSGAKNFQQWFDFLGLIKDKQPFGQGAPYQMDFPGEQNTPAGMTAMNESIPTCWDSAFKCSCGDCPDAPTCVPVSTHWAYVRILQDCPIIKSDVLLVNKVSHHLLTHLHNPMRSRLSCKVMHHDDSPEHDHTNMLGLSFQMLLWRLS